MKKLGIFISIVLFTFFASTIAFAQKPDLFGEENAFLGKDEVVDHDYFAAGEVVEIYGTVNGDLYAAGGQVIINGTINGDILAAGGQVTVDSQVSQNVRLAGGQISIDGNIGRNLSVAGGDITLNKDLNIAGNLVGGVGNLKSNATILGDVTMGAGNVIFNSLVSGDVVAAVGTLRLGPDTQVDGDVTYYSEEEINLSDESLIAGNLVQKDPPSVPEQEIDQEVVEQVKEGVSQFFSFARLISMISSVIVGYLLVHFFPNYSYRVISTIEKKPGQSILVGIAAIILLPIVGVLLIIPLITAPLGILTLIFYGVGLYFSKIFFMYWLGARILDRLARGASRTITLLIGIGLYYVLTAIAIIGPITIAAAILFGLGSLILTDQRVYLSGRKLKIF